MKESFCDVALGLFLFDLVQRGLLHLLSHYVCQLGFLD